MPTVDELFGYKIWIFTKEGFPLKPIHLHIGKNVSYTEAKVWIHKSGKTKLDDITGTIPKKDLERIQKTIELWSEKYMELWKEIHGEISYKKEFNREKNKGLER